MTEEQIKDLEALFELTNFDGWQVLLKDLTERGESLKEGMTRNEMSPYQLGLAQGRLATFRELISLRHLLEMALDQAKEDVA